MRHLTDHHHRARARTCSRTSDADADGDATDGDAKPDEKFLADGDADEGATPDENFLALRTELAQPACTKSDAAGTNPASVCFPFPGLCFCLFHSENFTSTKEHGSAVAMSRFVCLPIARPHHAQCRVRCSMQDTHMYARCM